MTQSRPLLILPLAVLALVAGCAAAPGARTAPTRPAAASRGQTPPATVVASAENSALIEKVADTERAFAQTMTDRNLKGFLSFLSPDAVFFSGKTVEHGVAEIADVWAPFFAGSRAPFAWQPDHVEVTADGKLALSTGPIMQQGKMVARFTSIWRLEGKDWHIVFDKGEMVCGPSPSGSS